MKKILYIILTFLLLNINIVYAEYLLTSTSEDINIDFNETLSDIVSKHQKRDESNNYGVNKRGIKITSKNKNNILSTPYVDPSLKIYDYADILDEEYEKELFDNISDFKERTNMEFIILTINEEFNDYENTTYATDFYDYNDFGLDTYNYDGVLLLRNANPSFPFYNIYTFGNARIIYEDKLIENILDDIYSDFVSGDYVYGINDIFFTLNSKYTDDIDSDYYLDDMGILHKKYKVPYVFALIISFTVTFIIIRNMLSKHKMIKTKYDALEYIDRKNSKFLVKEDIKISDFTRSYSNHSSSSGSGGGGSFGGGVGSSGRGFGGGSGRHG